MILVPFPLGYLVRNRTVAFLAYVGVHSFVFTFQSSELVVEWVARKTSAFGANGTYSQAETLSYGLVNLVVYAVGFGLVYLGSRVAARRRTAAAVPLDAAAA